MNTEPVASSGLSLPRAVGVYALIGLLLTPLMGLLFFSLFFVALGYGPPQLPAGQALKMVAEAVLLRGYGLAFVAPFAVGAGLALGLWKTGRLTRRELFLLAGMGALAVVAILFWIF